MASGVCLLPRSVLHVVERQVDIRLDAQLHARLIDEEVRRIVDTNYARAKQLLEEHEASLHMMAKALIKYETIDESQIKDIMEGREPQPPEDWDDTIDSKSPDDTPKPEVETGKIGGPAPEV